MTTLNDLLVEVRSTLRGYNLVRERVSFLNGAITSSATSIIVDDGTQYEPGVIEIGDECIYVQSISTNTLTVSPDGRGWDGTTAASHADNVRVTSDPPYPTWRLKQAINNTITGVWPTIFGVAATSFTYTPGIYTYSVPTEAENVLRVTTTVLGPSQDQVEINRFRFNSATPIAEFASGNSIELVQVPFPGQTVTVTYAKAPTALSAGADLLTASGLRDSARRCVVYGAVAELISFVDVTRALTDSALSSELAAIQGNRVDGTATRVAAQMTARYQMELDQELRRLRLAYPLRVRIAGR